MEEKQGCSGNCESCKAEAKDENCRLERTMARIAHKLIVMSGKGGVGKSTVAVNLACGLAERGFKVGLLDVDLHGPSIPTMLHKTTAKVEPMEGGIAPLQVGKIKVMSIGFLLQSPDDAVVWRGPVKNGIIQQLLGDVVWGDLDYLVVDCPPGTGDEPLSVCQMAGENKGAVVVTTPQQVAAADVARSLDFCAQMELPVYGLIENMSGFVCPHCGTVTEIFASGGGEKLAKRLQVPFAGRIPIDPAVCRSGDDGKPFAAAPDGSATAKAFDAALENILKQI